MSKQGLSSETSLFRKRSQVTCFLSDCGRTHLLAASLTSLLVAGLFFPLILTDRRLAFRDLGHFYEPLYRYLDHRSEETWFPLWGSLDHTGVPLAGDSTTALFYPLRVVFALPISVEARIVCYCIVHLLIAGIGLYGLCRAKGFSIEACWCAAVIYCGCGPVFFLYCNPPFLVGASWLPWMYRSLLAERRDRRKMRWVIGVFAVAFAVLGGDPQTAFHLLLLSLVVLFGRAVLNVRRSSLGRAIFIEVLPRIQWIASIVFVASLIASPQIAASWQWSRISWRAATAAPSFWSTPPFWSTSGERPLVPFHGETKSLPDNSFHENAVAEDAAKNTGSWSLHAKSMFDYSIAPWHLAEMFWPYFSGTLAPENQRWLDALEIEPRTWTPTMYLGLLSATSLIVASIRFRHLDLDAGIFAFALLCAIGAFGLGSIVSTFNAAGSSIHSEEINAVGGLYWILAKCIPGYNLFRYPGKWLSFVALSSSIITAKFVSETDPSCRRLGIRTLLCISGLSLLGLMLAHQPFFIEKLSTFVASPRTVDRFWGPIQIDGLLWAIRSSTIHAIVAAFALIAALKLAKKRLLLVVVLLDIGITAHWMIIESSRMPNANPLAVGTVKEHDENESVPPSRFWLVASSRSWPYSWRQQPADERRADDVELAQRTTWFVRWHLADRIHVVNNQVSIPSASYETLRQAVVRRALSSDLETRAKLYDRVCDFLGCDMIATRRASANELRPSSELTLQRLNPGPRTMTFHPQVRILPSRDSVEMGFDFEGMVEEIFQYGPERVPVVAFSGAEETGVLVTLAPSLDNAIEQFPFNVSFRKSDPEVTVVGIQSDVPGLLRWVQMQDGNWRCRYRTSPISPWNEAESYRVDGVAQGVFLPAGTSEVVWEYRPRWWYPCWIMVLIGLMLISLTMTAFPWRPLFQHVNHV